MQDIAGPSGLVVLAGCSGTMAYASDFLLRLFHRGNRTTDYTSLAASKKPTSSTPSQKSSEEREG